MAHLTSAFQRKKRAVLSSTYSEKCVSETRDAVAIESRGIDGARDGSNDGVKSKAAPFFTFAVRKYALRVGIILFGIGYIYFFSVISSRYLHRYLDQKMDECRRMFLSGVDIHHDAMISDSGYRCDNLLCDSIEIEEGGHKKCHWSYFAIDTLLDHGNNKCGNETHLDEFFPPPGWEHYQFTDGFNNPYIKSPTEWRDQYFGNIPKSSLLFQYWLLSQEPWNWEALLTVVKERASKSLELVPPENTIIIHVRVGDVIDRARESVRELLYKQRYYYSKEEYEMPCPTIQYNGKITPLVVNWNKYVKPLSYYSDMLDVVSQYSSVILMASAHKGGGIQRADYMCEYDDMNTFKSCQYINAIKTFFERSLHNGTTVSLRLGQPPDNDIVFSSQAECFMPSGGGFSRLLRDLKVGITGDCKKP